MARNTIVDVREKVEKLNRGWTEPAELSFEAWGSGENRYQLVNANTGDTYGPICVGASEFLKFLHGFEEGRRI